MILTTSGGSATCCRLSGDASDLGTGYRPVAEATLNALGSAARGASGNGANPCPVVFEALWLSGPVPTIGDLRTPPAALVGFANA